MNEIRILNELGDARVTWDVDVKEQVEQAQREFEILIREGYIAGKRTEYGTELITEFDKTAERIIMFPQISGG